MKKSVLLLAIFVIAIARSFSQNCTVNAGIDQTVCSGQPITLSGAAGSPMSNPSAFQWTKVSGPACTITAPTSLNTTITGTTTGNYVFRLSSKCSDGNFATNDVAITVLPPIPVAEAGPDYSSCSNAPIQLSATPAPSPLTGTWTTNPDIGTFSDIHDPNAIYSAPYGNNGIILTWTIENGICSSSADKQIAIVTPSEVSAGSDVTISCMGNCYTLQGSRTGFDPQTGIWTVVSAPAGAPNPVFSNPNDNNSTICNLVPGSYTLKWTVSGPCISGEDEVVLTVGDISQWPSIDDGSEYTITCNSTSLTTQTLTGAALATGETAVWTQVEGGAGTFPNVTFNPNPATASVVVGNLVGSFPYTFIYTKTNAAGCSASSYHTIYRTPTLTNFSQPADMQLPCNRDYVDVALSYDEKPNIYNGMFKGATAIVWPTESPYPSMGISLESSTATTRTDTWRIGNLTSPGTYVIRFEYRNACGPQYRDVTIVTSRTPGAANAGSNPTIPCGQDFANLSGSSGNPSLGVNWSQVSGPNTATLANTTNAAGLMMTNLVPGVYKMRLTNAAGGACSTVTSDVTVKIVSAPPATPVTGPNGTICAGRYRLTASIPEPTETGTWTASPSPGITFSPNANTPNAYAVGLATNTVYTFTWTVSNTCGSKSSSTVLTTTNDQAPPIPDAGADLCLSAGSTSATLAGNDPGTATVLWTALSAGSSVTPTNNKNTTATFTGGTGIYYFEYSFTNTCGTFKDTIAVTINNNAGAVSAGNDQNFCVAAFPASATLSSATTIPANTIPTWTQLSGPSGSTITSPNAASTTITNLTAEGTYEYSFSIKTGTCPAKSDIVLVNISKEPSAANAGPDQTICNPSTQTLVMMAANAPATGNGYWTVVSGPPGSETPTFDDFDSPTTTITDLTNGTWIFRWTIINGTSCAAKTDDVSITMVSKAEIPEHIFLCNQPMTTLRGNPNTTGTWSNVSGPTGFTLTTTSANTAIANNLVSSPAGTVYTFRYTIPAQGTCPSTFDDIVLTNYAMPVQADAGPDIYLCSNATSTTLSGNVPVYGSANWSQWIGNPNTVNGIPYEGIATTNPLNISDIVGGRYVFVYTVNNGTNGACPASTDEVVVFREKIADATTSNRFCNATTINLDGSTPVISTGTWTLESGNAGAAIQNPNNPISAVNNLVPGVYQFKWTIPGAGSCASTSTISTITIDAPLTKPDAGMDITFCEASAPSTVQLGATPVNGISYSWSPSDYLSNPYVSNPAFSGTSNAGNYVYTLKASNGSCESFDDVNVKVNPKPGANIQLVPECNKANFSATDVGSGVNNPTYNWTFTPNSNPTSATGAGPINVAFSSGATQTITLSVQSSDGCSNSKAINYSAPSCIGLPIDLLTFTAAWQGNKTVLNWKASNAVGFYSFEIERSFDGINFSKIGTVIYKDETADYHYEDTNIAESGSVVYYRLRMVDIDSAYKYSMVRTVNPEIKESYSAYPNPFKSKIIIRLTEINNAEDVTLKLYNSIGVLVRTQKKSLQSRSEQSVEMNSLDNLLQGVYLLQIQVGENSKLIKLIKY